MKCEEVREALEACSTGELEAAGSVEVERHLESCAGCRGEFVRLRQLAAFLRGTPVPPVPEGFAARVLSGAERPAGSTSFVRLWRLSSASLRAAAALVVAAGLLAGGLMGSRTAGKGGGPAQATDPVASHFEDFVRHVPESSPVGAYLALVSNAPKEVRRP